TLSYRKADGTMGTRRFLTWASHHGPIVREEGGKWIALALHNNPLASLQQSWLRMKVKDIAEFQRIEGFRANATVNTAFADSKGNIG
ncbi:penicillin acylase family protein, partial [Shewanella algae]|uniref:penicillin acylase family protein n=1 Tax=Shewanella algae TaxID=38313 RepID=UPI00313DA3EE